MVPILEAPNATRDRLTRVFNYLKALHELRNPVIRQVEEQPWKLWFRDLPEHSAVSQRSIDTTDTEDDSVDRAGPDGFDCVLKVARPELSPVPAPPDALIRWLNSGWDRPENDVDVRMSVAEYRDGEEIVLAFDDDPLRRQQFNAWHKARQQWAEREKIARKALQVFERLYSLNSIIERESERYELVLGDGLLLWNRSDLPVHHPVLLQRLELVFDPSKPEFRLVESEHPPELYTALFSSMSEVSAKAIGEIRDRLSMNQYHPLDGRRTSAFLKEAIQQLSPTYGKFVDEWPPREHSDGPRVGRQPVVFLRARTQGFGTAIEAILEDLSIATQFSNGLSSIVGVEPTGWGGAPQDDNSVQVDPNGLDEQILLSKEANASQIDIARRLEKYGAVIVQGPPGTGKTHTIANLLGHLLAQGKSVLVTAHTSKALRVLRDYVVEPLQPLCVSVLDGTSRLLERSIEEISTRLSDSDRGVLDRQANQLQTQRVKIIQRLRATQRSLLDARRSEYELIVIAGCGYEPSNAARQVAAEASEHSWIPSPIAVGAPLPLTTGQLTDLYRTNETVSPQDQSEIDLGIPSPHELLSPVAFRDLCSHLLRLTSSDIDFRADFWNVNTKVETPAELRALLSDTLSAASSLDADAWELSAVFAGQEGGALRQAWESLLADIESVHSVAAEFRPIEVQYRPVLPEEHLSDQLLTALHAMVEHMRAGGKIGPLQLILHRDWKTIVDLIFGGHAPRDESYVNAVCALAELRKARERLRERWQRQVADLGGPSSDQLGQEPEQSCRQFVPAIRNRLDWFTVVWKPQLARLCQHGLRWDALLAESPPVLQPSGELLRLRDVVQNRLPQTVTAKISRLEKGIIEGQLADLTLKLELTGMSPEASCTRKLRSAVIARDPDIYGESFDHLTMLVARSQSLEMRNQLLTWLEPAAPAWASAIRNRSGLHAGSILPGDPQVAWQWRQLADELDRRASVSFEKLQSESDELRRQLLSITAELVEKRTWSAQVRRTTLKQRQALNGWRMFVTKAGRRTGKRAPTLLAEARRLMPDCQSAVPVWIMPLSQVVENFVPGRNQFDVVIIDEASQADVMALTALYMGKQLLVVGDDQQVTPDAVGQRLDQVQQLIDTHLKGIPNGQLYDGQTSIYDLASTSFGGTIMLCEHFRCVPDIIQYSNDLSYLGRIQPLRDASSVQSRPHTVEYRVTGSRDERNTNLTEAKTVASLLIAATEQPEYRDASFGVISMLGADQAAVIDLMLQRHLSPSEYHSRRVQCGNPAQFQGDERDVVFLSMVYSPTAEGPLHRVPDPGERNKKRFNVAASRARDQLWVVHSLNPDVDLQPDDLRRGLILHVRNPTAAKRRVELLERRAESEFEREVLRRLVAKGYKVTPQWRVGPYRIDLVVEDERNRLAVECDGDRFHPPDKLAEDMARQAILERLGWRFIRLRGSRFFRDPESSMKSLFARLESLSIAPIGMLGEGLEVTPEHDSLVDRVVRRASELQREWGQDSDGSAMVPDSISSSVSHTVKRGDPKKTKVKEPVSKPTKQKPKIARSGPSESAVRPPSGVIVIAPSRPTLIRDPQEPSLFPSLGDHSGGPKQEVVAAGDDVVLHLESYGFEVIDKRGSGGALWIVGGEELSDILDSLATSIGFHFSYTEKGGKASRHRPAWYHK